MPDETNKVLKQGIGRDFTPDPPHPSEHRRLREGDFIPDTEISLGGLDARVARLEKLLAPDLRRQAEREDVEPTPPTGRGRSKAGTSSK